MAKVAIAGLVPGLGTNCIHSNGYFKTSGQDSTVTVNGLPIAVSGALFWCLTRGNRILNSTLTSKTFVNGLLVLAEGEPAGGVDVLVPTDRKVYIE